MYPVEYARWLLNPLRHLICPAWLIVRRLRLEPTDRVLEIGSGPGYFSPSIARRLSAGHLTLFDVQRGMLELAARRLEKQGQRNFDCCEGDAVNLPFEDGAFDVVLMVAVLGEVTDRRAALCEVVRVLKPGGWLSVTELPGDPDFVALDQLREHAREEKFGFEARFGPSWYFTATSGRRCVVRNLRSAEMRGCQPTQPYSNTTPIRYSLRHATRQGRRNLSSGITNVKRSGMPDWTDASIAAPVSESSWTTQVTETLVIASSRNSILPALET